MKAGEQVSSIYGRPERTGADWQSDAWFIHRAEQGEVFAVDEEYEDMDGNHGFSVVLRTVDDVEGCYELTVIFEGSEAEVMEFLQGDEQ